MRVLLTHKYSYFKKRNFLWLVAYECNFCILILCIYLLHNGLVILTSFHISVGMFGSLVLKGFTMIQTWPYYPSLAFVKITYDFDFQIL